MIEITDINDSRIELYKTLRSTPETHKNQGILIAEGEKVVLKLLKSNLEILSIFATDKFYEEHGVLIKNHKSAKTDLYTASRDIMKEIIGFRVHTGVMAMAYKPEFIPVDKLDDVVIIMNGIVDSENVGAIVRNCAAFGVESVIFDCTTSAPYLRRAIRVSMGSIFEMKVHRAVDIIETIYKLKKLGYQIISSELNERSVSLSSVVFPKRFALIFGSEAGGIQDEILSYSDLIIKIPINENIRSINVAASSAVVLNKYYNEFQNKSSRTG